MVNFFVLNCIVLLYVAAGFIRKNCCSYALVNWDVEPLSTSSCVTSNPALGTF